MDAPEWFFMWARGVPYITSICGWTRKKVIEDAESNCGDCWKAIYRRGGRAIKCTVKPKAPRHG